MSAFNLADPVHLASYNGTSETIERWHTSDARRRSLRRLLLRGAPETRGLRTRYPKRAHPKLPLGRGYPTDSALTSLRKTLVDLIR